jgi:cyclic-di-GMP-binding protein
MANKEESFDVVSDFDHQELINALDQVRRELSTRFDLKDSGSTLELEQDKAIIITTSDDFKLRNIIEILEAKLVKRGLNAQILDPQPLEEALGANVRQKLTLKKGIDAAAAKKVVARIKEGKLKVQASIQGEQIRVSGKNRDDLQAVIQDLRQQADVWGLPLQFNNFR